MPYDHGVQNAGAATITFKSDEARLKHQEILINDAEKLREHQVEMWKIRTACFVCAIAAVACTGAIIYAVLAKDHESLSIIAPIVSSLIGYAAGKFG
jgi:hypothetical protein